MADYVGSLNQAGIIKSLPLSPRRAWLYDPLVGRFFQGKGSFRALRCSEFARGFGRDGGITGCSSLTNRSIACGAKLNREVALKVCSKVLP